MQLENDLQAERGSRKTERFLWILVTTVLFDALLLSARLGSGVLVLIALTLVGLLTAARWLELPWAVRRLDELWDRVVLRNHTGR